MSKRKKLIAGNWKMNGLVAGLDELRLMVSGSAALADTVELAVCPPATLACRAVECLAGSRIALGGQDCHAKTSGAHTGDISAPMWADLGADYVIVGHSERRSDHGESSEAVAAKAAAVLNAGLTPIICLGETLDQRDGGQTLAIIRDQLDRSVPSIAIGKRVVIAYEPVWAIGTGRTPTNEQVEEVHADIRAQLVARFGEHGETTQILYGGSVKPENAHELMHIANVDGALVGGASLKAKDFLAIAVGSS